MNISLQSTYQDANELCRLGCKAINIEKFESAQRYFALAAEMGSVEAALSLELLSSRKTQVVIQSMHVDDFGPGVAQETALEQTHIFTRHEALAFRPNIQASLYTH